MTSTANLTGEEIADIAYAQPPIASVGFGRAIEVLIYVFTVVCAIIVALRVWVRTFRVESPQKWKVNDWLAVFGFVSIPLATTRVRVAAVLNNQLTIPLLLSVALYPRQCHGRVGRPLWSRGTRCVPR